MSSFTSLFLVVACAALLAGCDARQHRNRKSGRRSSNRRNSNDASVALGSISGSNVITLPVINLSGPDVIIGFPDNCAGEGLELLGTELIVSNEDGVPPVDLVPDNANDALSNVAIHCNWGDYESRCPSGIAVASYQYCGGPLPPPTTLPPSTPSSSAAPTPTSTTPSSTSSEN